MKECPDCCGDGRVVDERRSRDTLKVTIECETCHGSGEVKDDDEVEMLSVTDTTEEGET